MDGNGRWAPPAWLSGPHPGARSGHRFGYARATRTCAQLHLQVLTLYAFSKENWRRPAREVNALMEMLTRFLIGERDELMKNNVRLQTIGMTQDLPDKARNALEETRRLDRWQQRAHPQPGPELRRGATRLCGPRGGWRRGSRRGSWPPSRSIEAAFGQPARYPRGSPSPDLLVRHQRRDAGQQLPALADRLCRDFCDPRSFGPTSAGHNCLRR